MSPSVTERYVGARALWRTETFRELLVAFADPEVIGLSAIAGLLEPVSRREPAEGFSVSMCPPEEAPPWCSTRPSRPGLCAMSASSAGAGSGRQAPGTGLRIAAGSIALDGERELSFSERDRVSSSIWRRGHSPPSTSRRLHALPRRATASCIRTRSFRGAGPCRISGLEGGRHDQSIHFPLDKAGLPPAYRIMRTIREFEERLHIEFAKGDIPGFVHLYAGEEARRPAS